MDVIKIIQDKAKQYGISSDVLLGIVGLETGGTFNPEIIGDNGNSVGLLQVNLPAHKLDSSYIDKLKNPEFNLDFYLPELKKYFDQGTKLGLSGEELTVYVERYGQRPVWNSNTETSLRSYYKKGNTVTGNIANNISEKIDATPTGLVDNIKDSVLEKAGITKNFLKLWGAYSFIIIILIVAIIILFVNPSKVVGSLVKGVGEVSNG